MNSKGKIVWIVYQDYDYEGYSRPRAVFDSYDKAKQYVNKVRDKYQSWEIEALEVG